MTLWTVVASDIYFKSLWPHQCNGLPPETTALYHCCNVAELYSTLYTERQLTTVPAWGGSSSGSELWTSSSGTEPAACCVSVAAWPSPSASPRRSQSPTRPAAAGGFACGAASSSWPLCDACHRRPRLLRRRWRTTSYCRHRRRLYPAGTSASCR